MLSRSRPGNRCKGWKSWNTVKPTWKYRLPRSATYCGAVAPTMLKRESEGQSNAMPLGFEGSRN